MTQAAERMRFALLGDPVEHSRSPAIHRAALDAVGVAGTYEARRTDAAGVLAAVAEIRRGELDGANVTMPLKSAALDAADTVSVDAVRAGAVNTLRLLSGGVAGENTDVGGIRDVWARRALPDHAPVLILGAGGAAGAALVALEGREIAISARRPDAAERLVGLTGVTAAVVGWGSAMPGSVVVNATPLGMAGEKLPPAVIEQCSGLLDMAYSSDPTPAVVRLSGQGIPVADGLDLLVAQAVRSFEYWLGRTAPREAMEAAARA